MPVVFLLGTLTFIQGISNQKISRFYIVSQSFLLVVIIYSLNKFISNLTMTKTSIRERERGERDREVKGIER